MRQFFANIVRHSLVWRESWRQENERPKAPSRSREELAFLPAAIEVRESPPPPWSRAIVYSIIVFFLLAGLWAWFGRIDVVATARGKLVPSGQTKVIQPLEAGVVRAIAVKEGSQVAAGDVLVELDPSATAADRDRLTAELMVERVRQARLEAVIADPEARNFSPPDGADPTTVSVQRRLMESQAIELRARLDGLDNNIERLTARISSIEAQRSSLNRTIPLLNDKVDRLSKLAARGNYSKVLVLQEQVQLQEMRGHLEASEHHLEEAEAELRVTRDQRSQAEAEFRSQRLAELAEAEERIAGLGQELVKAQTRDELQTLRSPVDGVVQQLQIHTIGGVVQPAQELMRVVPADNRLQAEAMIENKDIGFVNQGQEAEIKLEAFPFTRYGVINSEVLNIDPDATEIENVGLVYKARLSLAKTDIEVDGKMVNLTPGMTMTAEVKTGKRRVLEFVLTPIIRAVKESGRER